MNRGKELAITEKSRRGIKIKNKPLVYPVPKYILGISEQGLKLWDRVKACDLLLEHKIRLAFRLSVVCRDRGDFRAADDLLDWGRKQIPKIPRDGCYSRELVKLALALWTQGLKGQAERQAQGLPGQIGDIFYDQAVKDLLKGGKLLKGWQMASQCSQSMYQAEYLLRALDDGKAMGKSFDVPRLLSK